MLQSIYKEQILIIKDPEEISETSSKAQFKSTNLQKKDDNTEDEEEPVADDFDLQENESPSKVRVGASKSVAYIVAPQFDKQNQLGDKCGTPQFNANATDNINMEYNEES
jgi:hypothetical protein